jgi:hypothetical protein
VTNHLTPRQYDLLLTGWQKMAVVAPMIMLTIIPLVFAFTFNELSAADETLRDARPFIPFFPLAFFLAFAIFYGWNVAILPYRITVTNDQRIVFKALAGAREVRVADMISIEPRGLLIQVGVSGYVLKHLNGKIRFPGQFTGQHALLYELKRANSALVLRGC